MTIALAAFLFAAPVKAQENMCGDYSAMERALTIASEQIVWRGSIGPEVMVEVWGKIENPQSWTLLVRHISGIACVKVMGDGWETMPYGQPS